MKLDWRTDSEPITRTWVNVPEGQLIAELGVDDKWRFAWILIDSIECRASARTKFQYRNFPTMDSIRQEVEQWYSSTRSNA